MGTTYRDFQPGDMAQQRALFALSFPETHGTETGSPAHYLWKFRGIESRPSAWEYVGEDDGAVVAYYAALPYRYRVDGQTRLAAMVCDVMTHPQWRGRGLFTGIGRHATTDLAHSGAAFTTGYPIRPEVIPGHLKIGWRIVQSLPVWLRPLGSRSMLPPQLRLISPILDACLQFMQRILARPRRLDACDVLERDQFLSSLADSPEYARFLERWMGGVPNALIKDAAFIRWRTGAPGSRYQFITLRHEGDLVGLAIVRPTELKGIRCLAVLDFMLVPGYEQSARSLHHTLGSVAVAHGLDAVACMCSQVWARRYRFIRCGYLRTPAVFSLIVKKLDLQLQEATVTDGSRWHVFWLDSDDL